MDPSSFADVPALVSDFESDVDKMNDPLPLQAALAPEKLKNFACTTKIEEILPRDQKVVTLQANCSVNQALEVLGAHKILSAPVVITGESAWETIMRGDSFDQSAHLWGDELGPNAEVLGFCSVDAIMGAFIDHFEDQYGSEDETKAAGWENDTLGMMGALSKSGQAFGNRSLFNTIRLRRQGEDGEFFYRATAGMTLYDVIQKGFLKRGAPPVNLDSFPRTADISHRIGFFNKEGFITNVVSQSDVIAFLNDNVGLLGVGHLSVGLLGLGVPYDEPGSPDDVASFREDETTLDAVRFMYKRNINAVAIVTDTGKLKGNLSISDFRTILPAQLASVLALPVRDTLDVIYSFNKFKASSTDALTTDADYKRAATTGNQHNSNFFESALWKEAQESRLGSQMLVTCQRSDTFSYVLNLIATRGVHRVYVVKDELGFSLEGVITLSDVLDMFLED